MKITIDIDDSVASRMVDAFCAFKGYVGENAGKQAFLTSCIRDQLIEATKVQEERSAITSARASVDPISQDLVVATVV